MQVVVLPDESEYHYIRNTPSEIGDLIEPICDNESVRYGDEQFIGEESTAEKQFTRCEACASEGSYGAYSAQSASMTQSNLVGDELENQVQEWLEEFRSSASWYTDIQNRVFVSTSDRNTYARVEQDLVMKPGPDDIKTIVSITHSDPGRSRGHSNENKLQKVLGELYQLKTHYDEIRCILFMGGPEDGDGSET